LNTSKPFSCADAPAQKKTATKAITALYVIFRIMSELKIAQNLRL
jgi:hypothetical protein